MFKHQKSNQSTGRPGPSPTPSAPARPVPAPTDARTAMATHLTAQPEPRTSGAVEALALGKRSDRQVQLHLPRPGA